MYISNRHNKTQIKNVGISHTKEIYVYVTTYTKRTVNPSNLVLSTSNMVIS